MFPLGFDFSRLSERVQEEVSLAIACRKRFTIWAGNEDSGRFRKKSTDPGREASPGPKFHGPESSRGEKAVTVESKGVDVVVVRSWCSQFGID